jgi:DNA-binding transcriptional ArsR family regulator
MIRLRLSAAFLSRMRFAYSPLAETAKSLYMINSGIIHPLHRGWYERVRPDLDRVDGELLRAVVPPGGHVAEFLFVGATATTTTIEQQLQLVADWPLEQFVGELTQAWRGFGPSAAARRLVDLGADGPPRVANALEQYWRVAVAPYWPQLRAVLDADVAYRVGKLAHGGIEEVMQDLHPSIELTENAIRIASVAEGDVDGGSLTLVPCVFIWPHLWVELGLAGEPSLTYGARGVGALWEDGDDATEEEHALGALLGRTRAEILVGLALPRSTTDLARTLDLTPPTVSAHLAILRRCGLVICWRSGRRVLYQRTAVGSTIVAAGGYDNTADDRPTRSARGYIQRGP